MRLKHVFISNYKNLKNFNLSFDGSSFINIFVGKNGSGKSNLLEALIEIFQHLYSFDSDRSDLLFNYSVHYEVDGKDIEIGWQDEVLTINARERKTVGKTRLPENVLVYYSGHNNSVEDLLDKYEASFRKHIKKADITDSRKLIGIGSEYKELLLAVMLLQPDTSKAQSFIKQKLGIQSLGLEKPGTTERTEPVIKLALERPKYAIGNVDFDIANDDESDRYWRAEGITRDFLDKIHGAITKSPGDLTITNGYFASEDRYVLYYDIAKLQDELQGYSPQELFRQFDNLKTLGMLSEVSVPLGLIGNVDASINHFSDGQFQSVYIYAVTELFKDRECITLLDEPDAFLHPEWQFDYLKQVVEISEEARKTNHILMSSHSASTLCNVEEQQISLFQLEESKVVCCQKSKKDIISELSDSFIQYSEDQSKLLIDNVIRSSSRPIMFVEGTTDVSILNTAYQKLYPGEDIPVLIQDAFDRGFIKILLSRNEVFTAYPDKCFFALFDFDDAYDDWRSMGGENQITDIEKGLCRKLEDKNAYTFLLPLPSNQLKEQVWDNDNPVEKIIPNPLFCIEHLFWGADGLDGWFKTDRKSGKIKFKGDKVKFATEVVPEIGAQHFEILRPLFEFIKTKCIDTQESAAA
ncbi:hypothetical protein A3749_16395 [Oleiphilus sp. HI0078]|nr:hypothetical protein A3743_14610 [Oleiphilus sp. HI0072]KZZ06828.1 hypothetical protein A3749_16395 [Oleiphilus sp. HI0078]